MDDIEMAEREDLFGGASAAEPEFGAHKVASFAAAEKRDFCAATALFARD